MLDELIMVYPPQNWICPGCGKGHVKSHYSLPGQIDYTKNPGDKGRILFNRRDKQNEISTDTPIREDVPAMGDSLDETGNQRGIYCPHCGFEDEVTLLIRTGELPNLVDRFFAESQIDPKQTWRRLLSQFVDWYKRRKAGQ